MVFVDHGDAIVSCDNYSGRYKQYKDEMILSVFFREAHAEAFAKAIASKYPGRDVHVFKQSHGYTATPSPVSTKVWTDDGQFIPQK
jgi:hypothetical protein